MIPANYPTSRNNALASVRKFIQDQCVTPVQYDVNPPWSLVGSGYENSLPTPVVSVTSTGLADLAPMFFGDELGSGQGSYHQFMAEIQIADRWSTDNPDAEHNVWGMRERIWYALNWSAQSRNGVVEVPKITLYDFDTNPPMDTNSHVFLAGTDNSWFEKPMMNESDDPNLKRIQILARVQYLDIRP